MKCPKTLAYVTLNKLVKFFYVACTQQMGHCEHLRNVILLNANLIFEIIATVEWGYIMWCRFISQMKRNTLFCFRTIQPTGWFCCTFASTWFYIVLLLVYLTITYKTEMIYIAILFKSPRDNELTLKRRGMYVLVWLVWITLLVFQFLVENRQVEGHHNKPNAA